LRREFSRSQLEASANDPTLLENLFFSDEAHFHLHGGVNRQDFQKLSILDGFFSCINGKPRATK